MIHVHELYKSIEFKENSITKESIKYYLIKVKTVIVKIFNLFFPSEKCFIFNKFIYEEEPFFSEEYLYELLEKIKQLKNNFIQK